MTVGNSLGVTLPPSILDALELEKGDRVEVKREDGCAILEIRAAEDANHETAEAD